MNSGNNDGSYRNQENARRYIAAREGLDGGFLIAKLEQYLPPGSAVLELGIGAGFDLDILRRKFAATGSDNSEAFLEIYRQKNPDADLLPLDAAELRTERCFDGIYSNKVLHHLTRKNLAGSFLRQHKLLNENGLLFHTFWRGASESRSGDLSFNRYRIGELRNLLEKNFRIIEIEPYRELLENDSIYLIARKIPV